MKIRLYGAITKTESQEDGTLIVSGIASSEAVDAQGEKVTAAAMKAAIPDYMKFGAVREMHDATKAAGNALSCEVQEDGNTAFSAHVVDPIAVTKCLTNVYKGFSIGGKVLKRNELNKTQIDGLRLTEISLVDRPANPDAIFSCFKADNDNEDSENADAALDGNQEDAASADVPHVDPEVIKAEGVEVVIDGIKGYVRKNESGGLEIFIPDPEEEIQKGAYSMSRLAELAEGLEYFAASRAWDSSADANSVIPAEARALAAKLYDMLLVLVGEDVATAKQRLKDAKAKKADEPADLAKVAIDSMNESLRKSLGQYLSDDATIPEAVELLVKAAEHLQTQNNALLAQAAPGGPRLKVVGKADDLGGSGEDAKVVTDPMEALKKVHRTGGVQL